MDQINERFSDFFRSMQCAGEVDLHSENEVRTHSPPFYNSMTITGCEAPIHFHNVMSGHPVSPFFHTQQTLGHMDWLFCSISTQLTVKDFFTAFCAAVIKIVRANSHNSNRHFVGLCRIGVTPVGVCWCWMVLVCRVMECQRSDGLQSDDCPHWPVSVGAV